MSISLPFFDRPVRSMWKEDPVTPCRVRNDSVMAHQPRAQERTPKTRLIFGDVAGHALEGLQDGRDAVPSMYRMTR